MRFANVVGRENVMVGSDRGFSTFAGFIVVDPKILRAKLKAMAEGARIASREWWKNVGRPALARTRTLDFSPDPRWWTGTNA